MTEEIIIDVSNCSHKSDDDCMEVPICNEYGDLMGYQSCEAQTLCPYRSQKKIEHLEQLKNKYYQQTLDDEITISDLIEEIQELKADRTLERISKLSIENASLEQENKELKEKITILESEIRQKKMIIMMNNDHYLTVDENNQKYRSALEEIKRVINLAHRVEDYLLGQDYTDLVDRIEKELEVLK